MNIGKTLKLSVLTVAVSAALYTTPLMAKRT